MVYSGLSPIRLRRAFNNRITRYMARDLRRQTGFGPILTLGFDDVPRSAVKNGAAILAKHGVLATWFIGGSYETRGQPGEFFTRDDLLALADTGHEIACHGFQHLDYQTASLKEIQSDLEQNADFFDDIGLPPAQNFAFPFGRANPKSKAYCGARFDVCRGVTPGFCHSVVDANLLASVPLFSSSVSKEQTQTQLDLLARQGGVLSLFSHGVTEYPTKYDCTPAHLDFTLTYAASLGISVRTLSEAMSQLFPSAK